MNDVGEHGSSKVSTVDAVIIGDRHVGDADLAVGWGDMVPIEQQIKLTVQSDEEDTDV